MIAEPYAAIDAKMDRFFFPIVIRFHICESGLDYGFVLLVESLRKQLPQHLIGLRRFEIGKTRA